MKHPHTCRKIVLLLVAGLSFLSLTSKGGADSDYYNRAALGHNSRFVVWRAADFGTDTSLYVVIDGVLVATLQRGVGYEAVVRPGSHTLTVSNTPSPYGTTKFTRQHVDFRAGQTHAYTAMWDGDVIVLVPSDGSAPSRRKLWY
jgi:hypothetical protein